MLISEWIGCRRKKSKQADELGEELLGEQEAIAHYGSLLQTKIHDAQDKSSTPNSIAPET